MNLKSRFAAVLSLPVLFLSPQTVSALEASGAGQPFSLSAPTAAAMEDVKTTSPTPSATGSDDFHLAVNVGLWCASMSGDVGVRELTAPVDVDFWDLLQDLKMGAMGGIEFTKGNWVVAFNGMYIQVTDEQKLNDGRGADTTANMAVLDLALGYTVVRARAVNDMPITITPVVGVRWTYLSLEVNPFNFPSRDDDRNWFDPYFGGQVILGLTKTVDWRTEATAGGFGVGSDFTWTVGTYIDWQFSEHVSLDVGYRLLSWDYDNDNLVWDITLQGPWIGLTFE